MDLLEGYLPCRNSGLDPRPGDPDLESNRVESSRVETTADDDAAGEGC